MSVWTNHYNRPISPEEQKLYDHFLVLSQSEAPSQLIDRFRKLFIEGVGYPESEMQETVEQIATSNLPEQEFKFILNRCCHILINRWHMQPRLQSFISDLVAVFETAASTPAYSRATRQLRELVKLFSLSEQYLALQRLANVMRQDIEPAVQNQLLGGYIRRYPYLYEHCLLLEDSSEDHRRTVRHIRAKAQHQFEIDLSQYITNRFVRSHQSRDSVLTQVKNPTLLADEKLDFALKQFACKVDGQNTQRDLALQFLTYTHHAQSFQVFKQDLYQYLIAAVDPEYGKCQFYDRLSTYLEHTFADSDDQKPNEFLIVRTCSRLLNFLVVDNLQQPNHMVFWDLVTNLGTTLAINLLLKIVLICQKVKPHLEKRFSILFNHYENCTKDSGIGWLIEALENLNIAFATNFGSVSLLGVR